MDFLSKITKSGDSKPEEKKPEEKKPAEKDSGPDFLTSAKGKAAGAGADAIGAVSGAGKLDKTQGVGKAAHDAEVYLRDVHTTALADKK
ncbi:hypothetical protein ACS0TY_009797 [Phlomoides rotata]